MRKLKYALFAAACCAILMGSSTLPAQDFEWVKQFGTAAHDWARAVAAHGTGVYVTGSVQVALPGQTYSGGFDAFVRKYDADGNEKWTSEFGTTGDDDARAVAVDETGVYVAGYLDGPWIVPPVEPGGGGDAFVRKYDADGNELWTKQFGTSSTDYAFAVAADGAGVYVAGYTCGVLPGQTSSGNCDAFVQKYDTDGNEVWTRQFGTSESDIAFAVAADGEGVYVVGQTGDNQTPSTVSDVFVWKYDADGNEIWTRQFGSSASDDGRAVAVDETGVYVAGSTGGTLPGQTWLGGGEAFVRKYDADGNELWTRQFGTSGTDYAQAVAVDGTGVYVAGEVSGVFPGQTSSGVYDAFVRKYDTSGTELWTKQFGVEPVAPMIPYAFGYGVAVDGTAVYVAGRADGNLLDQTTLGTSDAFLVKISPASTDTTPPVFDATSLYPRVADATSPDGAQVNYSNPTATDDSGETPTVICNPPSGSTFPIGSSIVTCTATDGSGKSATASFTVRVKSASEQVDDLLNLVASIGDLQGINPYNPMLLFVARVLTRTVLGNRPMACNTLDTFIYSTLRQAGRQITQEQADMLVEDALRIKGAIGCP